MFKKRVSSQNLFMKNNHKIIIGTAVLAILLVLVLASQPKNVEITTDMGNYEPGSYLTVSIKNNTSQSICFSGCYPYYLEQKKDSEWAAYDYGECQEKDQVAKCILKNEIKAFKLTLTNTETGFHRLRLPVCIGCAVGQDYRIDKVFYSNLFEVR